MGSYAKPDVRLVREPIAIVGSSCRFPGGANSPSKLWRLLKNPRDIVQEIPPSRFDTNAFYHQNSQHHGVRYHCPSQVANLSSGSNCNTNRVQIQSTRIFCNLKMSPGSSTATSLISVQKKPRQWTPSSDASLRPFTRVLNRPATQSNSFRDHPLASSWEL